MIPPKRRQITVEVWMIFFIIIINTSFVTPLNKFYRFTVDWENKGMGRLYKWKCYEKIVGQTGIPGLL